MNIAKLAAAFAAAFLLTVSAVNAATVQMTTTIEVSGIIGANTLGLSVGDTISYEVILDNGGGLESNTWYDADVVSATATIGTYSASFISPYANRPRTFATDASGNVTIAGWLDYDDNNVDSLGGPKVVRAYNNWLFTSDGSKYLLGSYLLTPTNWTATVIPLPAGLPLLLGGVGALVLVRRRKQIAA